MIADLLLKRSSLAKRWLKAELRAWKPTERSAPSVWAERHRMLSRTQSARPGPWRNAHAPYLTGLMDLCADRRVEELTIVKSAQAGVSEAIRNIIGYYAHQEPDPIMLVLPDEQTGRKIVAQRLLPLLRETEVLRELLTTTSRDLQLRGVTLSNGFTLRLGWSGSPASLASDPCRIVINDEVDKFQSWSGREADPISLGYARTQTYEGRRLIVNISTPTTSDGLIWRRHQSANVRIRFHVPCPHCETYQPLVFANLKWKSFEFADSARKAAAIENEKAAWYECAHCHQSITETHRPAMIRAGRWQAEPRPGETEPPPITGRVGVHLWAGYCLWVPWFRIAAEFIRCQNDPILLMGFTNSWLGEPFHQQITHAKASLFSEKCNSASAAQPSTVPNWARVLIATADTQKDHFYFVVRAWGLSYRSQRVDHGLVHTFDELRERVLEAKYQWEDRARPPLAVRQLGIDSGGTTSDSGSRTHEVYRFCLTDPARIRALKGASHARDLPIQTRRVTYQPPGKKQSSYAVFLTLIDTGYFKDRLSHAFTAKVQLADPRTGEVAGEAEQWELNNQNDAEYNQQLTAEHKVLLRKPGGRQVETWIPVSAGAANHYLDCEMMQFAIADMLRIDLLKPELPQHAAIAPQPVSSPMTNRSPIRRKYE